MAAKKAPDQEETVDGEPQKDKSKKRSLIEAVIREELQSGFKSFFLHLNSLNAYTERTDEAESRIDDLIAHTIQESTRAYRVSYYFYYLSYGVVFIVLGTGLYFALRDNSVAISEAILIVAGLILLLYLQTRNPIRKFPSFADQLVSIAGIYKAYSRQLNQIDQNFKSYLVNTSEVDSTQANEYIHQLQDAMDSLILAITSKNQGIED
jgi:hypothetical protein